MNIINILLKFFIKILGLKGSKQNKHHWINKWDKQTVKYKAQNGYYRDIRTLINYPSWIADDVLKKTGIKSKSISEKEKMNLIMKWVHNNIKYKKDIAQWKSPEFWADSDIILQQLRDDCEGYSIVLKTMTLAANIPDWKVKVVAGYTKNNKGHSYCIYLDKENKWVTADATWTDKIGKIPHKEDTRYGNIWFTFNKQHTFSSSTKPVEL